jgi:hypothetical protein
LPSLRVNVSGGYVSNGPAVAVGAQKRDLPNFPFPDRLFCVFFAVDEKQIPSIPALGSDQWLFQGPPAESQLLTTNNPNSIWLR